MFFRCCGTRARGGAISLGMCDGPLDPAAMRWNPRIELSPEEQALCARGAKHKRFYRFLRLHRHELFDEALQQKLASMYAPTHRGTEPKPPALLACAVLLQAYTGLSDEDVVEATVDSRRWQMVLDGLGTDKPLFAQSTLVEFRARLVETGLHRELLRRSIELAKHSKDFGYQAMAQLRVVIDSAPLEGAGKVEDTLHLLGHAMRLLVVVVGIFFDLPRHEVIAQAGLTLLEGKSLKGALDLDGNHPEAAHVALRLVAAQYRPFEAWWLARLAVGTRSVEIGRVQALAERVLDQNTEHGPDGRLRLREGVAPDRLISLSDPEMRHGRKHETQRIDGYKKYMAVDLDNDLVLAVGVLPANVAEARGADKLAPELKAQGPIGEMAIDRAFLSSELTKEIDSQGDRVVCRALPTGGVKGCFSKREFEIDLPNGTVRCPARHLAVIQGDHAGFATATCRACPEQTRCQKPGTKSGRSIHISPQEALLQKLIEAERTPEGRAKLRERTKIEHKQAHHSRRQGPVARYRGVAKNDFDVTRIAAVQNLLEIDRREREAERARAEGLRERDAA